MKQHKRAATTSISVVIPAYNEQAGIARVLSHVITQKTNKVSIAEILVMCDGCTDATAQEARRVRSPLITVLEEHTRQGKTRRLQQLFARCKGELIIMFDADISLHSPTVVEELCEPFLENPKVALVGGNSRPAQVRTFLQRAVLSTFEVFDASRAHHQGGNNLFGCTGSCLAIRSSFAKTIQFPAIVNEDAYLFFETRKRGLTFRYTPLAVVTYKLPTSTKDYVKQILRSEPQAVGAELQPYFEFDLSGYLERNKVWLVSQIAQAFVRNPLGASYVTALNLLAKPLLSHVIKRHSLHWFTAESTHL